MTLPNFIVIGAAKAGTTALNAYLAEHPDAYMSPVKETNFFAYELNEDGSLRYGDPRLHRFPVRSLEEYMALYEDTGDASAVGEASPIYLECPYSASRIHHMVPGARIICGLRNPVDRAYSDYQMYVRAQGRRLDPERDLNLSAGWTQPDSHWMRVSRYHEALARYFELFPREHIHVYLFDDLRENPLRTVQEIFRFLGIDSTLEPDFTTPYNVGGMPSNMLMERMFSAGASVRRVVEPLVPGAAIKWLRRLRAANMEKSPPLPEALRTHLLEYFREDIARTGELIGRDLGHWLETPTDDADTTASQGAFATSADREKGDRSGPLP